VPGIEFMPEAGLWPLQPVADGDPDHPGAVRGGPGDRAPGPGGGKYRVAAGVEAHAHAARVPRHDPRGPGPHHPHHFGGQACVIVVIGG
jgi:hypothetical protein